MDHVLGQPLGHEPGRRHRARGQQQVEIGLLRLQAVDQRQAGQRFADAGGVQPEERTRRPRAARFAEPFGEPSHLLSPAPRAPAQVGAHQGCCKPAGQTVEAEAAISGKPVQGTSLPGRPIGRGPPFVASSGREPSLVRSRLDHLPMVASRAGPASATAAAWCPVEPGGGAASPASKGGRPR